MDERGGGAAELLAQERTWGMLAHLSALSGLMIPFGNVLAPFLVWRTRRSVSAFVEDQAREALNFNLTMLLVALGCAALMWVLIGVALLVVLVLSWLVLTLRAAVKAGEGMRYRYPFAWRWVK